MKAKTKAISNLIHNKKRKYKRKNLSLVAYSHSAKFPSNTLEQFKELQKNFGECPKV